MSKNTGRTVYLRSDGLWANKSNDSLRASSTRVLRTVAADEARRMLQAQGGGILTIKNEYGIVLSREVVEQRLSHSNRILDTVDQILAAS